MPTFDAADGTRLAYHQIGEGEPLVCVPGGPMQASAYLGDLGGLAARRSLIFLDLRGTGGSAVPSDPSSYRCDRQVEDVEALRDHLGLDHLDLLGHSAGATLAVLYAARCPERIGRLVLANPSPRVVGLDIADADRRQVAVQRRGEPWFPPAFAAFERIWSGQAVDADWAAIVPFTYGRWDVDSQAHEGARDLQMNDEAAGLYYSDEAFDAEVVVSALTRLTSPVLLIAGEYDVALPPTRAAAFAGLFEHGELIVLPRSGHFPWLDDAEKFVRAVAGS